MKIHSIKIIDFRGIEDKTFEFNSSFNVLIGENGSGKTSVLEALAAAINSYVAVSQGSNPRPIRKEDVHVKTFEHSKERKTKTSLHVVGEIDKKRIEWEIKKVHLDFGFRHGNETEIKDIARGHFDSLSENGGKEILLPVFDYLGCGRLFQDNKPDTKAIKTLPKGSRYEGYNKCLDSTSSLKRFTSWYKTMVLSALQKNESAKLKVDVVEKAIINCLEGWESIFFGVEDDELMAERISSGESVKLPVSYLSDGQRNIIGMVADIAYRCVLLNPYLELDATKKSPGIVLIDELDLHLHPKWQRTIVKKLRETFPQIQFITTTHSPFIVQSLKNNELIDLEGKNMEVDYLKIGLEEIVEGEMGVKESNRSGRFIEMKKVADEYYKLIVGAKDSVNSNEIQEAKAKLEKLLIPFYDDPAYVTYLESFQHILNKK
jgi:predicted ATP-binding protein involved in virulence